METLFIYFLKSSGLIGMFYLAYYFLLRKETFFNSNRWYLLAGLISSLVLPLVVFKKIVWVDPTPTHFDWSKIPVTTPIENEAFEINWYLVFAAVYSIGILVFFSKFAFDFYSLSKVLKGKTIQKQADFQFINVNENIAPFSYFNYIVYNSSLYSDTELENILEHEKIHSSQNHTIDVLISSFFCVAFWFNPLVWLYKKAIVQNLEFIADSEASKNISDKKAYQLTLLKITTQENCVVLTNHFYQSLIKKRIVMLNKNQSNKRNSWKYAAVFPILGAFLFFFQVKVVAQEKVNPKQETEVKEAVDLTTFKIEKDLISLSKGKEIYVDGEKINEEKLAKINPNDIKTIDVIQKSNKSVIVVATKNASNQLTKPIKFTNKDIYIDGVKSTNEEFNKLDQSTVDKVDVNTYENTVRITTKNITEEKPLIDVNGQIMESNFDIKTLDQTKIKSTEVLRGIKATGNYGINHPYVIKIRTSDKNYNLDLEDALFIIDGKETDYNAFFNLRGKVKEIKVTDCRMYEGTSESNKRAAIIEYGLKAKNGVVVVKTIPFDKEQDKDLNGWKVGAVPSEEGVKQAVSNQSRFASYNAVVIIDGKIGDFAKEFHLLNPDEIASIKVRKVSDGSQKHKDEMVLKYGKKGLNGIVEVETKGFSKN